MNAGILTSGYSPPQLPSPLLGRATPVPMPQTARAYDADALAWITAVERADGQPLEREVCVAVDAFVRGCKADGIWNAIKACCIMCGARTLAGAIVPLVGAAPTNVNFVSSDYRRGMGLTGNALNKGLNSNRDNTDDPMGDNHLAVWITRPASFPTSTGINRCYIGSGTGTSIGTTHIRYNVSGTSFRLEFRSRQGGGSTLVNAASPTGLVGMSRSTAETISRIAFRQESVASTLTPTYSSGKYGVFGAINSVTPTSNTDATMSFYSIGTSLPLAVLEARVSHLMSAIQAALAPWPSTYYADADVNAYISAVEMADGQTLEPAVRDAINAFIVGCKADGIWDSLQASCILMGARTLSGAVIPLQGPLPIPNAFVAADYNRKTGLVSDGTTKYVVTGRSSGVDPQDSVHLAFYASTLQQNAAVRYMGTNNNTGSLQGVSIGCDGATGLTIRMRGANSLVVTTVSDSGFVGASRSDSAGFYWRNNANSGYATSASQPPHSVLIEVFRGTGAITSSRIAFYSCGPSVDLALLRTRVSDLYTAIGAAIQ